MDATPGPHEPDERDGRERAEDLISELSDFLADEAALLASLSDVIDELVAANARHGLDRAERQDLWRRIEAQVDPRP